ncbi:hypothetical protein DFH07DRAFT_967127 [Mycena maculata]|uniref:DUF6532 domain-containing protein n=1 Tax=Mycena maculata TaxID=230809 RepID=A0AAD7MWF5_9AGAR|nr:hypothetical protein DFH07DRAFT_967127 [Mycena maculata]
MSPLPQLRHTYANRRHANKWRLDSESEDEAIAPTKRVRRRQASVEGRSIQAPISLSFNTPFTDFNLDQGQDLNFQADEYHNYLTSHFINDYEPDQYNDSGHDNHQDDDDYFGVDPDSGEDDHLKHAGGKPSRREHREDEYDHVYEYDGFDEDEDSNRTNVKKGKLNEILCGASLMSSDLRRPEGKQVHRHREQQQVQRQDADEDDNGDDRQDKVKQEQNVLDKHRQTNRATRPPDPVKLVSHREQQSGGQRKLKETEGDVEDEERRKTRSTRREVALPTQEGFYSKPWRRVFANAKDRVYIHLLLNELFPYQEEFRDQILTLLAEYINHFEEEHELNLDEESWVDHRDDMIGLIWVFIATFRARCKTAARAVVKEHFDSRIWPKDNEQFHEGGFLQAEWATKTVKKLLHRSEFHQNGVDENGKTNNFMSPTIDSLLVAVLDKGSRPLAREFPREFSRYSPRLIIAMVVFEYESGFQKTIQFTEEHYAKFYNTGLVLMDQLQNDEYHWKKCKADAAVLPPGKHSEELSPEEYWMAKVKDIRLKPEGEVWVQVNWYSCVYSHLDPRCGARLPSHIGARIPPYACSSITLLMKLKKMVWVDLVPMVELLEDDPEQAPILPGQFFYRYFFDTKSENFTVHRYICDAQFKRPSGPRSSPSFGMATNACICGEPYSPDSMDPAREMHWCPRPDCRRAYHTACLLNNEHILLVRNSHDVVCLRLASSADADEPVKIPEGATMLQLATELVALAAQPIVRGGAHGVVGNVAVIVRARRVVHAAIQEWLRVSASRSGSIESSRYIIDTEIDLELDLDRWEEDPGFEFWEQAVVEENLSFSHDTADDGIVVLVCPACGGAI